MSFGAPKKKTGKKAVNSDVQFQFSELPIRKITKKKPSGPKVGLVGPWFSGKSIGMLSTLFMNLEFADIYKEKYPAVFKGLKSGFFPEVEKAWIIESENKLENQLSTYSIEQAFSPILDRIDLIPIDPASRLDKMNKDRSIEVDIGSIKRIEEAHYRYQQAVLATKDFGPEVMVGFDSASRYYDLINTKQELLVMKRTPRESSDRVAEGIKQSSWQWRNGWWNEVFTTLRGHTGFVLYTFMEVITPKHYRKEGDPKGKIKWVKGTQFNLDQIYNFYIDHNRNIRYKIEDESNCRYMDHTPGVANDWAADPDMRLSLFSAYEAMVKSAGEW